MFQIALFGIFLLGADPIETPNRLPIARLSQPYFADGQDPKPAGKVWVAVEEMTDEFDGDQIDLSKWQIDPRGNGWGWIGRAPGLFRAENVVVSDGSLNVTVGTLPEPRKIGGKEYLYQGAIVRSNHPGKVGQYFEARMKANQTEMSSTFWLITKNSRKRQELDIQECVGKTGDSTAKWARRWNQIFHSNLIRTERGVEGKVQFQKGRKTPTPNHERFYVYAAWWKSPREIQFFLDGEYQYTLRPDQDWDLPNYIQLAIETYDWNPVPEDGGMVKSASKDERTTRYDWIRVWELE